MIRIADQTIEWRPGLTLADVVDAVEGGHLVAVVRLNEKLISRPLFASTSVPDHAELELLPMIAGG
jgi:thiamine biosynthesis protein ThiS